MQESQAHDLYENINDGDEQQPLLESMNYLPATLITFDERAQANDLEGSNDLLRGE